MNFEAHMGNLPTGKAAPKRRGATEQHELERRQTLGRTAKTGELRLKHLTTTHQRILAMYLTGDYSIKDIVGETGVSRIKINQILLDPLCQKVINEFREAEALELGSLQGLAMEAVRHGLNHKDADVKLKAVDRFVKLKQDSRGESEENRGTTVNVTINNAREKFVGLMRDVTPTPATIEGSGD